jgi:hypothetical protein
MAAGSGTEAGGLKSFEAFEVPLESNRRDESLQGAFAKYRTRKKVSLGVSKINFSN